MPLPLIIDFGDESHAEGESGLQLDGFDFGPILGEVWMYQNSDRTGFSDELTVVGGQSNWGNNQILNISIPGTPNNSPGPVYAFVKRFGDQAWSPAFSFTLEAAGGGVTVTLAGVQSQAQLGSFDVLGSAQVALGGRSATSAVGQLLAGEFTVVELSGQSSQGQVGTLDIAGHAAVSLEGQENEATIGQLVVAGTAIVNLTGFEATAAQGTLSILTADLQISTPTHRTYWIEDDSRIFAITGD